MLHLLYIVIFTILAVFAVWNLVRNLITLGSESRVRPRRNQMSNGAPVQRQDRPTPHPELLDIDGNVISEPLLVMRSISMKDAREQLDALYEASKGGEDSQED
ncbi:MAG: DUF2973 domain-containing protein [Leptolyngbyaceae cyanobacterium SM1_1_3]|nr:DUF2973 domain-containing protein [Leptolyngbyaceae cyanobacterium SM1_1_3]NJN01234.1 DUF2973 domain-containing protein [Leptolyngbyaceae cyanobacterium RM1_1_2]NJO11679.1 DUF2973 domain-containing protein [Leptolyngbyaceae cyanobacterium SL_1_1]